MSILNNKNFEPYKIPERDSLQKSGDDLISPQKGAENNISFESQYFSEIEIGSNTTVTYKSIPISQSVEPIQDEKRKMFNLMREISRNNHSSYFINSKFYDKQLQYEKSKIFYLQAVFMKDFEDDFDEPVSFSAYFPYYQLMSYEQLRTYFTWRTRVRNGIIEDTSLSYAFVYIYELLNNIGVDDPQDGLEKLISFWKSYKVYNATIDKYIRKWMKDYHIYYELPKTFKEFLLEHNLKNDYPDIIGYDPDAEDKFEQFCGISKYNIKQSAFYNEKTSKLIHDCFHFVIEKLLQIFDSAGMNFNELIFHPSRSNSVWNPFNGALFYPTVRQANRRVVLSNNEIYTCYQNRWLFGTIITVESGRNLLSYIFKQMEIVLRKIMRYKYKISVASNLINSEISKKLSDAKLSLEKVITEAVLEFHIEANKTIVSVDESVLKKIRSEAKMTQEILIVPEDAPNLKQVTEKEAPLLPILHDSPEAATDDWTSFKKTLSELEIRVLAVLLEGQKDIKKLADQQGVMIEVLIDSINEKALETIGDNILDFNEGLIIYDEYKEKVMILVGSFE